MPRPPTTVLITGAGSGLGQGLARHFAGQGAQVLTATRLPASPSALSTGASALSAGSAVRSTVPSAGSMGVGLTYLGPGPFSLSLDVASDTSLLLLSQRLRSSDLSIDLFINLANVRQIVGLDRLDLTKTARRGPPLSFEILALLRVAYAILDRLAEGVRVICVATSPETAGDFGSLSQPPRVSPSGLHAGLRALAAELLSRRGLVAVIYPDLGQAPNAHENPGAPQAPGIVERLAWIAATVEQLCLATPPVPPRPLYIGRRAPSC